jgi:hypothetical protein
MDMATTVVMGLGQALGVLVGLAAIVIAIARWARHPLVSMLVVVAMGLRLLLSAAWMVVPRVLDLSDRSGFLLVNAGLSLLGVVALALLVAAVFVERSSAAEPPAQRW